MPQDIYGVNEFKDYYFHGKILRKVGTGLNDDDAVNVKHLKNSVHIILDPIQDYDAVKAIYLRSNMCMIIHVHFIGQFLFQLPGQDEKYEYIEVPCNISVITFKVNIEIDKNIYV